MRRLAWRLGLRAALLLSLFGCAEDRTTVVRPPVGIPSRADATTSPSTATIQAAEPIRLAAATSDEGPPQDRAPGEVESPQRPLADQSTAKSIFADESTLTPARLIQVVQQRNPTLDQMRAAAAAAQSRYPQVVSLDDPMFGFATAPGSAWSSNANYAARVELTQKLPWSGKRELRGQAALAEADAATRAVDESRLQLIEAALNAFAEFSFSEQALAVNKENLDTLDRIRKDAAARLKNLLAPQQDVLQADVEIARQQERTVTLERMSRVAKARLNTLMHLPPDSFLPPPEKSLPATEVQNVGELRARAADVRPELKILADRIAADEAAVALAMREYKPDVELLAAYDGFWQGASGRPLQWQVGAKINLPVRNTRRAAAVVEAQARLAQRRAELSRLTDQVNLQVQESYELLQESGKIIRLYEKTLLPAAEANVREARASYVNGKVPFVSLAEAQRTLVGLKERYLEVVADAVRRRAALERAVGGVIENRK